jgi:hypothetical protein
MLPKSKKENEKSSPPSSRPVTTHANTQVGAKRKIGGGEDQDPQLLSSSMRQPKRAKTSEDKVAEKTASEKFSFLPKDLLDRLTQKDPDVCHLDVSGRCTTDADVTALASLLMGNPHVRAIKINNLGAKSTITAKSMVDVAKLENVSYLDVSGNPIGNAYSGR